MPSSNPPCVRRLAFFLCGLSLAFACSALPGQDAAPSPAALTSPAAPPPGDWPFRYDLFKMSLERSGLEITRSFSDVSNAPSQSVIVHVGNIPPAGIAQLYQSFVRRGGALLLASDRVNSVGGIARFSGLVVKTREPAYQYQNRNDCIRVSPSRESELTMGVSELVFNRASHLGLFSGRNLKWKADLIWPDYVDGGVAGKPLVASARAVSGGGSVVLCADHSIFTNAMLWHADNAMFVLNASKALASAERDQLYFVDGRRAEASYEEELKKLLANAELPPGATDQVPELEIEQMLRIADTVIANSEDANLLNAYLQDRPRRLSSRHYNRSILFAIAAAISCLAVYQLARRAEKPAKRPAAPAVPTVVGKVQQPSSEKASQRGEAARLRSRDTLRKLTGSESEQAWESFAAGNTNTRDKYLIDRLVGVATQPPMQLAQSDLLEVDSICRDMVHNFPSK